MYSFGMLLGRAVLYVAFVLGVYYLFSFEGYSQLAESQYRENSITEALHYLFAFLASSLFFGAARLSDSLRPASVLFATLLGAMFIREFDAFLDDHLLDGSWQVFVTIGLLGAGYYLYKQSRPIGYSLVEFSRLSSAGILASGLLIILVWSRLFGQGSFWEAVMGDNHLRVVKNIAEEGTELMGYTLLVIAAFEFLWYVLEQRKLAKQS